MRDFFFSDGFLLSWMGIGVALHRLALDKNLQREKHVFFLRTRIMEVVV